MARKKLCEFKLDKFKRLTCLTKANFSDSGAEVSSNSILCKVDHNHEHYEEIFLEAIFYLSRKDKDLANLKIVFSEFSTHIFTPKPMIKPSKISSDMYLEVFSSAEQSYTISFTDINNDDKAKELEKKNKFYEIFDATYDREKHGKHDAQPGNLHLKRTKKTFMYPLGKY